MNIQRFFDDGTATRLAESANLLARYRYQIWRYGDSIGFEGVGCKNSIVTQRRVRIRE